MSIYNHIVYDGPNAARTCPVFSTSMLPVNNNVQIVYMHDCDCEQHLHALEVDCERHLHALGIMCEQHLRALEAVCKQHLHAYEAD